jgi:2-C-methyl-D-erythritol 4-phosphate cytidylyltransferase/2-C-methyl-D-erythritol 2,4-cyclodiphosphate synthase
VTRHARADAVVVAAGSSRRMDGRDKLELPLGGRPILRWSVEALAAVPSIDRVIVVTAPERLDSVRSADWIAAVGATVVPGGARRQESVTAGVRATSAELVLVHDAARPLVSRTLVERVLEGVRRHGAAIPALPVVDALKQVEAGLITDSVPRGGLFRAQTPQGARRELLLAAAEAYAQGEEEILDEAELLARAGHAVAVVAGDPDNVKVTLPQDLAQVRRLAGEAADLRVTLGTDSHPFGPDSGLRLGGLLMEAAPQLQGHSDGDVVLHALCDALLAAVGGGDLGRLFPAGEQETRGIDSRELVRAVIHRVQQAGTRIVALDLTIVGSRPRLGSARLEAMAANVAELAGIERSRVSVKAATANLAGDEGAGRVISASCLATVVSP